VAQTYRGNVVTDLAVILAPEARQTPENLPDLLLKNAAGVRLPLRELADVYQTTGRSSILHEGARRRQTVTCNVEGRSLAEFQQEAQTQLAGKLAWPSGTYAVVSGSAEATKAARRELAMHSTIAAVGIVLLLFVALRHRRNVALVLLNVPFALIGGIMAIWIAGRLDPAEASGVTIGSLVGFVTLFGITMRNSIMLISHYEHLVLKEGLPWNLATALRGAQERVIPILMTALVTALGLMPLALGGAAAGREIEGPMALVILGGLVTSTLLNILVLPTLALRLGRFEARAAV